MAHFWRLKLLIVLHVGGDPEPHLLLQFGIQDKNKQPNNNHPVKINITAGAEEKLLSLSSSVAAL